MALDLAHTVSAAVSGTAPPTDAATPDRQLLTHILRRAYHDVRQHGATALAYMPVSGARPVCCIYAPNSLDTSTAMAWAALMRRRAEVEFGAEYDPDEPALMENLAGGPDSGPILLHAEERDRVLMAGERPVGLLRVAASPTEPMRWRDTWGAIGALQPRFEAAAHVLTGPNAIHDPLIGTYSRAFLDDTLRRETARADRHALQLSLAIVQVRPAQTPLGVAIAAAWLRTIVDVVRECVRETDIVASISSATFGVVMPNTGTRNALVAAGRIIQRLSDRTDLPSEVSCHVGISGWDITGPHVPEIIEQATAAMNEAKRSGGGRPFLHLGDR